MKRIGRTVSGLYHRLRFHPWLVFLTSLLWFLVRTGSKPGRAVYPCQQAARINIFVFGLPIMASFWLSLKEWKGHRLRVASLLLLTLFVISGTVGLTKAKTRVVGWFWELSGALSESRVQASNPMPRVVWVHDRDATNWDYGDHYYGREEYVDQSVIDSMTDLGLMALTATGNVSDAWQSLIPGYQPGQKVAVKVNLNANWEVVCEDRCETNCGYHDLRINALPQPVNALIRGLKQFGVAESDIWVYEATKPITERFKKRVTDLYPDVQFYDSFWSGCSKNAHFNHGEVVDYQPPVGITDPPDNKITDVLVDADYLINMPVAKKHGGAGVTLSFKNHLGSILDPGQLHDWLFGPGTNHSGDHYSSAYSPLIDLYQNSNFRDKTVLIVGDGLYGDKCDNNSKPKRWEIFDRDAPNSLYFSADPVAVDSIMYDSLQAETCTGHWEPVPLDEGFDWPDDYLALAEAAGLGVFEHGDPWQGSSGYTRIDLVRCEDGICPQPPPPAPHPRLFFGPDDLPALQAKAATTNQEIWIPIRDYVDSRIGTSPPVSAPVDGDLDTYRNYGNQLIPFAFTCLITGEAGHCDLAKTYLLTYAAWDQWGEDNHRDLGHAHMLLGNSIAYDWLYNDLTPAERETVRNSLTSWAQKMYEASSQSFQSSWSNWWRKAYVQNHYWINHGALGMAGLALRGDDARAQFWIDQARSKIAMAQYMADGIQDGSWHEGIPYQSYGLTLSLPFMVNLRRIQGDEVLPHVYLRNYPYWRIYNHIPGSTQFILSYGDFDWTWGDIYSAANLLRFTAREYGDGYAEWMAQQLIAEGGRSASIQTTPWYVFEFLYFDSDVEPRSPADLETRREFTDLEGVIWRTGWGANNLIFGLKTGAYGGRFAHDTFTQEIYPWEPPCASTGCQLSTGHDHDDSNGFYIYRMGRWLAPEREGYQTRATSMHNALLIDGQGQYRPPDDQHGAYPEDFIGSDGFLEATVNTPDFDYVAADATRRYKNVGGLEDVTRHVVFVRPGYFVMLDNLAADEAHQYDWVCHFGESISVEGNWLRGEAGDGQILGVGIVEPQQFGATIGNDGYPYAHIRPATQEDDARLIHVLYPTDDASWNTKPSMSLLDDTGTAVAVRVEANDGSNRTDDVLLAYAPEISAAVAGPFYFDGAVAVVRRGADDDLDKLFMYGGTLLLDLTTGTALVANLDRTESLQATYLGETVAVFGNRLTGVILYAPQAQRLTVNGIPWPFCRSGAHIVIGARVYLPFVVAGLGPMYVNIPCIQRSDQG